MIAMPVPGRMAHNWSDGICLDCGAIGRFDIAVAHFDPDIDAVPPEGRIWLLHYRNSGDPPFDGLALWRAAGGYVRTADDLRREAREIRLRIRTGFSHDEYAEHEVADLLDYRADRMDAGHG